MALDLAPYQKYLQYVAGDPQFGTYQDIGMVAPVFVTNPDLFTTGANLFDVGYDSGNRRSLNPYYSTDVRDVMRDVAGRLGLTPEDADRAALDFAQLNFDMYGQPYSDFTHPGIVADQIAQRLFAQAGKPYEGLTPEQKLAYINAGYSRQSANSEADQSSWKRSDVGGIAGVFMEHLQGAWEKGTTDGFLPSEQALAGADNPLNTWIQNKLRNKDWDPYGNEYGLATKDTYKQAQEQGYDTGAAAFLQMVAQQAMAAYAGATGAFGELTGPVVDAGANAAGVDASYIQYAKDAKTFADYYKQYQNYRAGGEINPGAVFSVASAGAQKVGDFDSSAFTGGDSPYNSNSFFDESRFGTNYAGGTVYDENGNWLDGEYDQYGNFIPSDQTTFGDDYGAGYGQGNDIYGGGNLEQSNPELFGGTSGGLFTGLGGLFSGLTSNPSLGGLLSSNNGGGNNLIALAPILAAIQHARQIGPYDTSRLTNLADQYSPDSMAYQYDRNTELQRGQLNSSLADRGVIGSSFGNMDISNFNTNRELGRGALISQASLGGADIANKILQAQIQQRNQQNQLYGSALYALGNVFGGKR